MMAPGGTFRQIVRGVWAHLLAYNLLRTVMAVAAAESGTEPRQVSFKGAKQAVTAFAPKLEAARPEDRPALVDALLAVVACHRVGERAVFRPLGLKHSAQGLGNFKLGDVVRCQADGAA